MTLYNGLIGLFWLIFIVVWIFSSFSAKKNNTNSRGNFGWRIFLSVVVFFIFRTQLYRWLAPYDAAIEGNPAIHLIGVIVCGVGILFAIWARFYLGSNWGMPMTLKEEPELVTKGPYAFVRHPIYTGILLAITGSVLASSVLWLVMLGFSAYYFIPSAKVEEELMEKEFPEKYPAYKKRTKMLVPFVY